MPSTCYELYRVTFRHNDVYAEEKWSKETKDLPDDECPPPPEPRKSNRYIAICTGTYDSDEVLGRAAELALLAGVGSRDCWERYEPLVLSVKLVDECITVLA